MPSPLDLHFQRNNDNGEGGRGSNKGNTRNNSRNNDNDNRHGRKGKDNTSRRRHPYDTNKSCELHGRGHSTEECIVLKVSNGKLANNSHLAEISKTNNEARTAITNPISTIPISTTASKLPAPSSRQSKKGSTTTATSKKRMLRTNPAAHAIPATPPSPPSKDTKLPFQTAHSSLESQSTMSPHLGINLSTRSASKNRTLSQAEKQKS